MKTRHKGAEEARNTLPELLDLAERGRSTIITKHGRAVAALVPIRSYMAGVREQQPLTALAASGRGLWGKNSAAKIDKLRGEWER
ncbi:MAG TPA: type II toxin-antitoxin system Phd/YefM family antitoxin [Rhizomicrobium sp.]|jgi:prevent-host-death family protein